MAKFTVKVTGTKVFKQLSQALTKSTGSTTAKRVGKATVDAVRDSAESGRHTIKGKPTNFSAYRGEYRKRIRKFGKVGGFRKSLRPVNLTLSGEFLKSLKFKTITRATKTTIQVGFFDSKNADKERGHREGANGQAKRPIIPAANETFKRPIIQKITGIIERAVARATSKV